MRGTGAGGRPPRSCERVAASKQRGDGGMTVPDPASSSPSSAPAPPPSQSPPPISDHCRADSHSHTQSPKPRHVQSRPSLATTPDRRCRTAAISRTTATLPMSSGASPHDRRGAATLAASPLTHPTPTRKRLEYAGDVLGTGISHPQGKHGQQEGTGGMRLGGDQIQIRQARRPLQPRRQSPRPLRPKVATTVSGRGRLLACYGTVTTMVASSLEEGSLSIRQSRQCVCVCARANARV